MVSKATEKFEKDKKKFKILIIFLGVSAGVLLIGLILFILLSGGKGSSDEMMDF